MAQTSYELDAQISIPSKVNFSIRPHDQGGSGAHSTSHPIKTENELTTHLQLVPKLKMRGALHPCPLIRLHGIA
jgi:hypothetical protein